MANTDVTVASKDGVLVPSQFSVPVSENDTIGFSTSEPNGVYLFFSPDAAAVLSPTPSSPVSVSAGTTASFTFKSSQPGAYSVYFGADASSAPACFPAASSNLLLLEVALDQIGFSVIGGSGPKTG